MKIFGVCYMNSMLSDTNATKTLNSDVIKTCKYAKDVFSFL